jgi:RimJ/RimL family protein N-acetyltransferase
VAGPGRGDGHAGDVAGVGYGHNPIIEKVSLDVFATNHGAIRLYKRLGFVKEGLRPKEIKFGPGRYADGLTMYKFVK